MIANEQSRKGISEIEGKVAEGSDERERDASEFQTFVTRVADREELPSLLGLSFKFREDFPPGVREIRKPWSVTQLQSFSNS